MNAIRIAAIALIVSGALSLFYGAFTYTKETHRTHLGALELTLKDRETIHIPIWAGVAAVMAGGLLLVMPRTRKP
jgi:TRAP-type C4-dicarboxylate transport system permease small subunit